MQHILGFLGCEIKFARRVSFVVAPFYALRVFHVRIRFRHFDVVYLHRYPVANFSSMSYGLYCG